MKKQIEKIVSDHNDAWLDKLPKRFNKSSQFPSGEIGLIGKPSSQSDDLITLDRNTKASAAVCAIVDNKQGTSRSDDLIVLAVGINYGQGNAYLTPNNQLITNTKKFGSLPSSNHDDTGLRKRLESVLMMANRKNNQLGYSPIPNGTYQGHLVVGNFFPFITDKSWSGIPNSIQEAVIFKQWGWSNPTEQIVNLIDSLMGIKKTKLIVVFHGANNAVPILGVQAISSLIQKPNAVILCDNLAHGNGIRNVELLW